MAQTTSENDRKPFGWNGLSCEMPRDWDLSNMNTTRKNGYFSFDDERFRRLEIKFDKAKRLGKPDLEKTLNYYFDSIRKKLKRHVPFDVEMDIKLTGFGDVPEERNYRTYGWSSDAVARGMIWHCTECNRITIAQCMSPANKANLREMGEVLRTIKCHPEGEEQTWAVFDFCVQAPKELSVVDQKLQAGFISLTLDGKPGYVVIDRLGMASAVVKHTPLDRYVEKTHYKKLRGRRLRFYDEDWHGYPGFRIEGERKRLLYWIPVVGPIVRDFRRRDHIGGRVWFNQQTNRIYVIRAEGRDSQDMADRIAETVVEHETLPESES